MAMFGKKPSQVDQLQGSLEDLRQDTSARLHALEDKLAALSSQLNRLEQDQNNPADEKEESDTTVFDAPQKIEMDTSVGINEDTSVTGEDNATGAQLLEEDTHSLKTIAASSTTSDSVAITKDKAENSSTTNDNNSDEATNSIGTQQDLLPIEVVAQTQHVSTSELNTANHHVSLTDITEPNPIQIPAEILTLEEDKIGGADETSTPSTAVTEEIQEVTTEHPIATNEPKINDPIHHVIQQILEKDSTELQQDQEQYQYAVQEEQRWAKTMSDLNFALNEAHKQMSSAQQKAEAIVGQVSEEIKGRLTEGLKGLQLVVVMLARIQDRMTTANTNVTVLLSDNESTLKLPSCNFAELQATAEDCKEDLVCVRERAEAVRQKIGQERYEQVRQTVERARKDFDTFRVFIERQVLPVLDGLDDGERFSKDEFTQWKEAHPGENNIHLDDFIAIYRVMHKALYDPLKEEGVSIIPVTLGAAVDFELHEPFDTEPDPAYPDASVKSVIRNGYIWKGERERQISHIVLRPVQVVVVKNEPVEHATVI